MPKMNINKSIYIDAKPEEIYNKLNDFHHWKPWSPWLIMEDGVQVDVDPDGKFYSWDGKRVGSGNMKILNEKENESIQYDLHFLKPWKSQADVTFKINPKDTGAEVSWTMESKWPIFLFWMKGKMEAFIGMDYERGLRMLKDYIEDGEVHSELDPTGYSNFEGMKYLGIKGNCDMDKMGEDMEGKMNRLMEFVHENNVDSSGEVLSVYHEWDVVNRKASYTAAVQVNTPPANLSEGLFVGEIPETKVHAVEHKGAYEHLGNAWGLQYMMQRGKEFKGNKKVDPFEIYKNDPTETPKNDRLTQVCFPVK